MVARSNEAKILGVKMGQPWHHLNDLVRQQGIIGLSSNYALYADISNRFVSILGDFSPVLEVYSVDECFLCVDGLQAHWSNWEAMGQAIRRRLVTDVGLPVCVGFAPTKTLAKLANHVAKKQPALHGVCDFTSMSASAFTQLAAGLDVGDVWGIGGRLGEQLRDAGIATIQALRDAPHDWLRTRFGVVLSRLWHELHGVACIEIEEAPAPKKQIISSRSFGTPVLLFDDLASAVSTYVTRAAEKLRAQASTCETLQVFVMTNAFRPQDPQYSNAVTVPLPNPSNDTRLLVKAALFGLRRIYRERYRYKKAGVVLNGISDAATQRQRSIFPLVGTGERSDNLM